jgi:GTPase
MLVDEVTIFVQAGSGGAGCVSFRREKYIPKGGPDGGNGGNGGSVYVAGVNNPYALKRFREQPQVVARSGESGSSNKKHGANAPDLIIKVPYGTRVRNLKDNAEFEVLDDAHTYLLAKGGRGGRGNWEFRSSTNQTPRYAEPGKPGQQVNCLLQLQLIADIGLVGLPNAGKSTLLNALTAAKAKTAPYPFTTLEPNLGTLKQLVIADIPGLIEGASTGKGLGTQFLRHVERTKLLVHCLSCESDNLLKDYQTVRQEMLYSIPDLDKRPELVLLTKTDLCDSRAVSKKMKTLEQAGLKPLPVSVLNDNSLAELKQKLELFF